VIVAGTGKQIMDDRVYVRGELHELLFQGLFGESEASPSPDTWAIAEIIMWVDVAFQPLAANLPLTHSYAPCEFLEWVGADFICARLVL
jgi:hypothetical protein